MKRLLTILLLALSFAGTAQNIIPRGGQANTPQDARLSVLLNLVIPRYADTVAANIPYIPGAGGNLGLDSCGAVIFTYNDNAFWYRACNPKRWVSYSYQTILPDGVYSGGQVSYSGVGLGFIVSPATFVLGGIIYNSPQKTVILDPADPALDRIDDIVLTALPTGADKITGQPGTNQQPSVNPQTQLFRAFVRVPAGSLVPAGITQLMIYDEDLGLPDEWTPSTNGGTVNFAATDFPYHLTIDANVTAFTTANSIDFTYSDTVHTYNKGTLVSFIRLGAVMPAAVNLNYVLTLAGNPVSQLVNFTSGGMSRNITAQYQGVFIPFPAFGAGDIVFDGIRIIATGIGIVPQFDLDYIQMQVGLTSPQSQYRFGVEDNNGTQNRFFNQNGFPFNFNNGKIGFNTPVAPVHTITVGDEIGGNPILYIYGPQGDIAYIESPNEGSLIEIRAKSQIGFTPHLGSAGGKVVMRADGNANQNVSLNFYNGGASEPPEGKIGTDLLEAGVSNEFFIKPPHHTGGAVPTYLTLYDSIKLRGIANEPSPDSLVTIRGGVVTRTALSAVIIGSTNANIGAGYRWAVPNTNNVKTAFVTNGILADSSVNTNGITFQVDSAAYTTIGRSQKLADSITTIITALGKATNVGAGYRLVIPNVNQIKTLFNSYAFNWDSTTNVNGLTGKIDTTLMSTRAFAQSLVPGGVTGVTSVSVASANGIAGSVATPTSTPVITISTTITGLLKGNGTAISAAVAGTDYLTPTGSAALLTAFPTLNQNTTGTAATITGIATVPHGGSGLATLTPFAVMAGGTTGTGNMQQVVGLGTAGQALVSNGAGALPTWQTIAVSAGVSSLTGTANRVTVSAATGAITISGPQDIATVSSPTFRSLTLGGNPATTPLTFVTNTDAAAAAGRWYYNSTRLGFSLAATILRVPLTNDVAPANGQIPIGNGTNYTVSAISPNNNTMVITNGAGSITVGMNMTPQTLTDGATITWNAANGFNATVVLGGVGRTLTRTNWVAGATYNLKIVQDGTGNRTITTWPAGIRWPGGIPPTLSTAAGSINIVSFYFDGVIVAGAFQSGAYL